jgi:hypothetical protein
MQSYERFSDARLSQWLHVASLMGTVVMKYEFVTKIQVPQHSLFLRTTLKST